MTALDPTAPDATKEARDRTLAAMFQPNETVYLVSESYDDFDAAWQVDVVRRNGRGVWMRQRYRYDTTIGIVHFRGERPMKDEELGVVRRSGKRYIVGSQESGVRSQE